MMRWFTQALSHASPEVRRAAARVVAASGLRNLVPAALDALATERDVDAAGELIRAVAFNADARHDRTLIDAGKALGIPGLAATSAALAWARGDRALIHLDELGRTDTGRYRTEFLAVAARGGPELTRLASRAVRDRDVELWRSVLAAADWIAHPLDAGIIRVGLSLTPEFRSVLLWEMATARDSERSVAGNLGRIRTEVLTAARKSADVSAAASVDARFAASALARRLRDPAIDDPVVLAALDDDVKMPIDDYLAGVAETVPLTPLESSALARRAARRGVAFNLRPSSVGADAPETMVPPMLSVRTVSGFPNGFVEDVLRISKCRPAGGLIMVATVECENVGRVGAAEFGPSSASTGCVQAFETLVRTSFRKDATRVGATEALVLVPHKEFLSCLAEPEPAVPVRTAPSTTAENGGVTIQPPTKIRQVQPRYPVEAQMSKIEGNVVIESVISATGCVREARLVRTVHPTMSGEALLAVTGWRFTPTRVGGIAVPATMIVTVQFTLR